MRRLVLSSTLMLAVGACASGEEVPSGPIFSTTNTNNTDSADTDDMSDADTGDADAGDGDGGPGDGDGGPGDGDGDDDPTGADPVCGDGVQDGDEECDGNDLNGLDCTAFGFQDGSLVCADNCTIFTNACSTCGDGSVEGTEVCDGNNFEGKTCASLGYASGSLSCAGDCSAISEAGCMQAAACGNGVIDGAEACDGGNLNGQSCAGLGFDGGSLSCTAGCQLETAGCTVNQCIPLLGACDVFLSNCCETLICLPVFGCAPE